MSTFMLLVFAMLAGACALVVVPLIRGQAATRDDSTDSAPEPVATVSVVVVVIALPLAALVLYGRLSAGVPDEAQLVRTAPAASGETLPSIAEMAAALEQRLTSQPDDQRGWEMLGRTYVAMQRFAEAVGAYDRALALSTDRRPALLLDTAEAMAMADPDSLTSGAGELIEEALDTEPANRKGLWYGGSAAFERGDYRLARDRWQALAADSPPEALLGVLNQRIAAAEEQLGTAPQAQTPPPRVAGGGDTPTPAGSPATTPAGAVAVSVSVAPELAPSVAANAPLFVLARSTAGGPPLAVVRRAAGELPLNITLSDANAMIAGRTISSQESVEIVARVALGGGPVASPGDLFGTVNYNVGDGGDVSIVIDRVQQ